jgi:hypothetical protein
MLRPTRRDLIVLAVGVAVGVLIRSLWDVSWLDADEWFDLWMTLLAAVGTFVAVWLGARLALGHSRRAEDRARRDRAIDEAIPLLTSVEESLLTARDVLHQVRRESIDSPTTARVQAAALVDPIVDSVMRFQRERSGMISTDVSQAFIRLWGDIVIVNTWLRSPPADDLGSVISVFDQLFHWSRRLNTALISLRQGEHVDMAALDVIENPFDFARKHGRLATPG